MSDKIDFPLLNNHNYHEWKNHAMSLLQSKQLYRLVTGVKLHPTSPGNRQNDGCTINTPPQSGIFSKPHFALNPLNFTGCKAFVSKSGGLSNDKYWFDKTFIHHISQPIECKIQVLYSSMMFRILSNLHCRLVVYKQ
jgi:hypothetical protein